MQIACSAVAHAHAKKTPVYGPVVQGLTFCAGESSRAGSNPGGATCIFFFRFFFSSIVFLLFGLFPFILIADTF